MPCVTFSRAPAETAAALWRGGATRILTSFVEEPRPEAEVDVSLEDGSVSAHVDEPGDVSAGARFFDAKKRDRGWATKVTRRSHTLGALVVLDVTTTEPSLAGFLRTLDKGRLHIRRNGPQGRSYVFTWASGYENGTEFRVRGVLER
jgi:hypothetical protein